MSEKKKAVFINGSPRKGWNTHQLLERAMQGAQDAGADTVLFHLYAYRYRACVSCFSCKRVDEHCGGLCAVKDELTPVLEEAATADAIILGCPVYLHSLTGQMKSFLDRLLYPVTTYLVDEQGRRVRYLEKQVKTAWIFTMNNTEEGAQRRHYDLMLGTFGELMQTAYGHNEIQYVYDTYQFSDYADYQASMFDADQKRERQQTVFPKDLEAAYQLGQRLAKDSSESH